MSDAPERILGGVIATAMRGDDKYKRWPLAEMCAADDRITALEAERDALVVARDTMGRLWEKEKARADALAEKLAQAPEAPHIIDRTTEAVRAAAQILLNDLARALDDMSPSGREAGQRWSAASEAAETAPTYMHSPTPIQMIRAALQCLAAYRTTEKET